MNRADSFDHIVSKPRPRLFTFSSGGWVLLIAAILTLIAAFFVLRPAWETGFRRAIGDGQHVESYLFDLSHLSIPRSELVASGVAKDQIGAIPVSLIQTISPAAVEERNKNEREQGHFLVSSDRVIGVEIGGEARAYPLRVLSYHEVANDVLGGVPIAVTYAPLCDSAVVFDRRIDPANTSSTSPPAGAPEFGVSGLLVDSNLVMFDRRKTAKEESLWPQLALHAVSGPAVGKALKVLPFAVMSYKRWTDLHPDTRVLEGLRTHKAEYKMEPFSTYYASDELKYPVALVWNHPDVPKKTRITVISNDGGKSWRAQKAGLGEPATAPAGDIRLFSFVFAWYAQHPTDTDYSAIVGAAPAR